MKSNNLSEKELSTLEKEASCPCLPRNVSELLANFNYKFYGANDPTFKDMTEFLKTQVEALLESVPEGELPPIRGKGEPRSTTTSK